MKKHDMVLSSMDNDVWITCSCGAKMPLGSNCPPEYAVSVATEHKELALGLLKITKSEEPFADGIIPRWCCD